jgi:hypothetical protein
MNRASTVALLIALIAPAPSMAQRLGTNIEVFSTGSLVAGVAPVTAPSGSMIGPHGGFRIDVGLQIRRVGVGVGGRYWQMAPTDEYGGQGADFFFIGEWRPSTDTRTTLRGAWGYGFDDFDSGHGPERPLVSGEGYVWSVGIGRQVIAPFDTRVHLSADLVVPTPTAGSIGRRRPVLEIGVGYRFSQFQSIIPLP